MHVPKSASLVSESRAQRLAPRNSEWWKRRFVGTCLGYILRVWVWTLRVRVVGRVPPQERPWVLGFFHGDQFPLLAWRGRRRSAVLVSHSRDGELQSGILAAFAFRIVRGSSSRGAVAGQLGIVRAMRSGLDAVYAVDGPKGPYGRAQPGIILAARAGGAVVVPLGVAAQRRTILSSTWDKFTIPHPFSKIVVAIGTAIDPADATCDSIEQAIRDATEEAQREFAHNLSPAAPVHLGRPSA